MAKKERTAKREALIKRAQELRDKGFTLKEISKSLNIGSEEYGHIQVHRMLKKAKVAT
jgi:orotate phosphoribosyltransferase-like protein